MLIRLYLCSAIHSPVVLNFVFASAALPEPFHVTHVHTLPGISSLSSCFTGTGHRASSFSPLCSNLCWGKGHRVISTAEAGGAALGTADQSMWRVTSFGAPVPAQYL